MWKYHDNGVDLGTAWRADGYGEDSSWQEGLAELGYGDGDEKTILSYGPNASSKYPTYYFRKTFTVADPAAYGPLSLTLLRDDGAIVYLNGTEVHRVNMPAGTVVYTTYASSAADYVHGMLRSLLITFWWPVKTCSRWKFTRATPAAPTSALI